MINKEIAIERIAGAYEQAATKVTKASHMKNIVIVGPPGSYKTQLFNMIIEKCSVYEKAVPVTNRELWPNERGSTHIFTNGPLKHATKLQIITGTIFTIGEDEHGTSLNEIARILSEGKKFITFTNIGAALVLKEILGDDVMVVYLQASKHVRETNMQKKLNQMLLSVPQEEKGAVLEKIPAYLSFGDEEIEQYKKIAAAEKKASIAAKKAGEDPAPLKMYCLEHGTTFNPHKAVQFILDNAQADYALRRAC